MSQVSRRRLVTAGLLAGGAAALGSVRAPQAGAAVPDKTPDRDAWLSHLERVAQPVLQALSTRRLRQAMPVEAVPGHEAERAVGSPLEAFARLLSGLAPWLELEPSPGESSRETGLRQRYRLWSQQALASALDPASPDYMRFGDSAQTLVDSSFLSLALLRAPAQLLKPMSSTTRKQLIAALEAERKVQAPFNNWLLFAALNEVLLRRLGAFSDPLRIAYALREHQSWYVGDGTYGDGPEYHADFYNSYVIHPYLMALMDELREEPAWKTLSASIFARASRYAAIQERLISPTGEFPVLGRSITYRTGVFHLLADAARRGILPPEIPPAAVRCALTAVQGRTLAPEGTFSSSGWLQIGLAGHQPSLAETYISTGSLYLCSLVWLPLGLPPAHPFWADPAASWTQKRVWSGGSAHADHAFAE